MWSIIFSILVMIALNEELDKSQYTLTAFFMEPYPSLFSAVIFSVYVGIIAWYCARDGNHICIACLSFLSTQIAWLELLFNDLSPPPIILTWIAYNSFGAMLCICFTTWLYHACSKKKPEKRLSPCIPGISLAVAHLIFSCFGPVVHHTSSMSNTAITVVQLSDLHVGPMCRVECTTKMVNTAMGIKGADLFVITGDVMDGAVSKYRADAEPLRRLAQRATTVMITGNHDHLHGDVENVSGLMASLGMIVLRNEAMIDIESGLRIVGLDDSNPNTSLSLLKDSDLILVHRPAVAAQIARHVKETLILSGHTHCGQMLPIMPLIWAMNYPYFCGQYRNVYVSSGSGQWGPNMRMGYSAEIAVHALKV